MLAWSSATYYSVLFLSFFANLTLANTSQKQTPSFLLKLPCYPIIQKQVLLWVSPPSRPHWVAQMALSSYRSYLSPTPQVGSWLEWRAFPEGRSELIKHSAAETTTLRFSAPTCDMTSVTQLHSYDSEQMNQSFTDQGLKTLLDTTQKGILYAWSPSMPFSIQGANSLEIAAKQLGMKITYIRDPHSDSAIAALALASLGQDVSALKANQSLELYFRGVGVHYPAIVVFDRGQIKGQSIPGVKTAEIYRSLIRGKLRDPFEFPLSSTQSNGRAK